MRISYWSPDLCSSDLDAIRTIPARHRPRKQAPRARCLSPLRCNRYIDTIQADLTASDIMGITLREASEKVGVTRQTLMKAIKAGRVSAEKSDNGDPPPHPPPPPPPTPAPPPPAPPPPPPTPPPPPPPPPPPHPPPPPPP